MFTFLYKRYYFLCKGELNNRSCTNLAMKIIWIKSTSYVLWLDSRGRLKFKIFLSVPEQNCDLFYFIFTRTTLSTVQPRVITSLSGSDLQSLIILYKYLRPPVTLADSLISRRTLRIVSGSTWLVSVSTKVEVIYLSKFNKLQIFSNLQISPPTPADDLL